NYGYLNNHWHNQAYWQGEPDFEPTVENGEYYQVTSRNNGFRSLKINPYSENSYTWTRGKKYSDPWKMLMAYSVRLHANADSVKWIQRACAVNEDSLRQLDIIPEEFLTEYRTPWMAGDAGKFVDGEHVSGIPQLPGTLMAVDYDYYNNVLSGEGLTYHSAITRSDNLYRKEGGMAILKDGNDFAVGSLHDGDWMSYTFSIPETGTYQLSIEAKGGEADTQVGFAVDGSQEVKGDCRTDGTIAIGKQRIQAGARVLRIYVHGGSGNLSLSKIILEEVADDNSPIDYVWNSRDYSAVSGAGEVLNDRSSQNLYAYSYSSTINPTFTIESSGLNYRVDKECAYLAIEGTSLDHAALKKALYRLSEAGAETTKTSTAGQNNQKTIELSNGGKVLVWKLDSAANKRITPLFKGCYVGNDNPDFLFDGMTLLVYGSSLKQQTNINKIVFLTEKELKALYGQATAIRTVNIDKPEKGQELFTLDGKAVSTPTHGIYVGKGKKYIFK
ncbi:MAG: hypothetical protein ACI4T9_12425, partial [Prevotella sp.]